MGSKEKEGRTNTGVDVDKTKYWKTDEEGTYWTCTVSQAPKKRGYRHEQSHLQTKIEAEVGTTEENVRGNNDLSRR